MVLLPEWNAFTEGIAFGIVGIVLGAVTVLMWRKMENKAPVRVNGKAIGIILLALAGALVLGTGMCFCLVGESFVWGTIIGLVGIVMLLSLIPIIKGIK